MKRLFTACLLVFTLCFVPVSAQAESVGTVTDPPSPEPELVDSPLIITAYHVSDENVLFVQIFNESDEAVDLAGWQVVLKGHNATDELELTLAELDAWLVPEGHIVVADETALPDADVTFAIPSELQTELGALPEKELVLVPPEEAHIAEYELAVEELAPDWIQRNRSTSTGNYLSSFTTNTGDAELEGRGLYLPLDDTSGLVIVEILANARDCSPTETDIACGDFIKLYNPTGLPIELSQYRLRTDSGGLESSSSNTFSLDGALDPGAYKTVHLRGSGDPISITNSGGFVWLEDTYGVTEYGPIVAYPDAGGDKKGFSWGYTWNDDEWKWMEPAPDEPNYWSPEAAASVLGAAYIDCGEGRELNPETNRCRKVASTENSYVPCDEGEERNPATNRCRSIASASSSLKPCSPTQYRNPETNRCKSIESSSNSYVPCKPDEERNPETNRCRKVASSTGSVASVYDIKSETQASMAGWYVAGAALLAALAYAIYEWRQDISQRLAYFQSNLKKGRK